MYVAVHNGGAKILVWAHRAVKKGASKNVTPRRTSNAASAPVETYAEGSGQPSFKNRAYAESHSEAKRKKMKTLKQVQELMQATWGQDEGYRAFNRSLDSPLPPI